MVAVAFGILWAAYAVGIWGYCLVRGYDVSFTGMFGGQWPAGQPAAAPALPNDPGTGVVLV